MFEFDLAGAEPEEIDKAGKRAERTVRELAESMEEMGEVTGEGESANGMVRAAVDGSGLIVKVRLDPRAMRMESESLAEALTDAVRAAQEDARRKTEELLRSALGGDSLPTIDIKGMLRQFEGIQESFTQSMDANFAALDRIRRRSS